MNFDITIQGRGGHGSRPDRSINPVDCFAAIFGALAQLPGNVTVTSVDGGTSTNVIPDVLRFQGTCEEADVPALKQLVENICTVYQCTAQIDLCA